MKTLVMVVFMLLLTAMGFGAVQLDKGQEVTIGGWESADALKQNLAIMQENGVTSHEVYVPWARIEKKPGQFDFSDFDPMVDIYRQSGLKWVPFLILSPAYSLPDWYYKSKEHVGYVCLEHKQESDVQSLWNPNLPKHVDDFLREFAKHYKDSDVIESLLLGISGNYGEALYPASGNDWTADRHGQYHTHSGYWCGDVYAVADFQKYLQKKYGTITKLNQRWNKQYTAFSEIQPQLKENWNSDLAWLDQMEWYRYSMLQWEDFWMKTTRKYFPNTKIYLCTGGVDLQNWLGADFSAQVKIAKKYNAGVRITNEASEYNFNFTLTRMIGSAGKFYHTFYGFEPAGFVSETGVVARVYNASASGALQLHYYCDNLFGDPPQKLVFWQQTAQNFKSRIPVVPTAVLYPKTYAALRNDHFIDRDKVLRDVLDHDYVDERMVSEGALKNYKYLVIIEGNIWPAETYKAILNWVKRGGILVASHQSGPFVTPEKDSQYDRLLFPGESNPLGKGHTYRETASKNNLVKYCRYVAQITGVNPIPPEKMYDTLFNDGTILRYDANKATIQLLKP